jgi:ELWxxDGT repeat protein
MKSYFLYFINAAVLFFALEINAQKPFYPKPNSTDQIPFGKKLPPPSMSGQQYLHLTSPYPRVDSSKQSKIYAPGRITEEHLQPRTITGKTSKRQNTSSRKATNGNFHLTKDINALAESDPKNYTSYEYPAEFAVINNVSFFYANDGIHGFEIWRSDATSAGTTLLKDINLGAASLDDFPIVAANGKIYFPANDGNSGVEPWVSDGTGAGTHLLMDIGWGSYDSYPGQFVAVNNSVFFLANNNQLWKTDGTAAGTSFVKGLYDEFQIFQLTAANGLLFFVANSYSGWQLWRSDGTDAGTYVVKQISYYLWEDVAPMQLTEYNNKLFFSVDDGTGRRLWRSDGTYKGTTYVTGNNDVFMQTDYLNIKTRVPFKIINNVLYLAGYTYGDGSGLYKFDDASNEGVTLVQDLTQGWDTSLISPVDFAVINDHLYFKVISSVGGFHDELWRSNGSAATTQLVKAFLPGEVTFNHNNGNGLLYFNKVDAVYGNELWKSDGTLQGTMLVKDIWPGTISSAPYYLTECNGKLLFNGADDIKGASLYVTDGTTNGTTLLKDVNTSSTNGSNAGGYTSGDMVRLRNGVVFSAYERGHGYELYKSDGKASGTILISDIIEGDKSSYPNAFLSKNGLAYFRANNANETSGFPGSTIYKTDGTINGTKKIVDIDNAYFLNYNVTGNNLVFYLIFSLSTYNYEVWRSDGTANGTYMLAANINPFSNPYIVTAGNNAFFIAGDYNTGYELWKSDGSKTGTQMVKDINQGYFGSYPYSLFEFKNEVYFGAYDGTGYSYSLWKSDGTSNGTIKLKDISPAYGNDAYGTSLLFCASGNNLFLNALDFNANPYVGGELYKTDGTPAGTELVKDINPNPYQGSNPYNLTNVNGMLFFTADNGINGDELWQSNGTAAGTNLIKDISPGWDWSKLTNLCSAGDNLYFLKDQYSDHQSLWSSDGTAINTNPVEDAGLDGLSSIKNLVASADKLFFGAYSYKYKYGTELYQGDATIAAVAATRYKTDVSLHKPYAGTFEALLFPNPTHNITELQIKGNYKNIEVAITNMVGGLVSKSVFYNRTKIGLPTEKLTAGVYMVTIKCGVENKSIKLVKQ